ncbi:hypothetical protein INR49_002719 [Caranx melampygus]|nr:hypothetical protein INR49_002719 [Caranx melampygus]
MIHFILLLIISFIINSLLITYFKYIFKFCIKTLPCSGLLLHNPYLQLPGGPGGRPPPTPPPPAEVGLSTGPIY